MSFRFDHSYTNDKSFKFRTKLGKAGFYLNNREVEHPGKHFCRFIFFPAVKDEKQYLEFVHIPPSGIQFSKAGLSLGAATPLEPLSKKLAKNADVKFIHKNYDWKKNSTDRLPGWNFITFSKHKSEVFTWATEYESSPNRKPTKAKDSRHPNGCYTIQEINMQLSPADLRLYTNLLGKPKGNQFFLKSGKRINFTKAKKSKMDSIVVLTNSLKKLVQKYEWDELISYNSRPAVIIKNPNVKMWNLIITE